MKILTPLHPEDVLILENVPEIGDRIPDGKRSDLVHLVIKSTGYRFRTIARFSNSLGIIQRADYNKLSSVSNHLIYELVSRESVETCSLDYKEYDAQLKEGGL